MFKKAFLLIALSISIISFSHGIACAENDKGASNISLFEAGCQGNHQKKLVWATAGLYGTEWRIAVISEIAK